MNHVIVSDPLNVNITGFAQPTELRDQSGYVLGVFTPVIRRAPGEPEDTLEELEAAANEPGGYTLEEIWRELGVK
ncbi:MAG: hypothetical protein H0T51_09755 [Pirellulales bacterium]|nr:hypothetical protein [Pirellulales bacterium]